MRHVLEDGLVLRSLSDGVATDRERLPDFYAEVNAEGESEWVKESVRLWTRDLIERHPTVTLDDLFVVVDPAHDDRIASAALLIPQTWRYEDILLPAGRPELCGTLPDYRGRGYMRALFAAIHQRSMALRHVVQGITGIPHFYRQFGYTMAVDLGHHAWFPLATLPDLPADHQPAYRLRPATSDDIPAIQRWSAHLGRERLLSDALTADELRYEITGRYRKRFPHTEYLVIVDAAGQGVGYLTLLSSLAEPYEIRCIAYAAGEEASYFATFTDVAQGVRRWCVETYGTCPALLAFGSGLHETVDQLIAHSPGGSVRRRDEYAWYLRLPQSIDFLKQIAPVLERRLMGSGAHRYSGELKIGYFDLTGMRLQFHDGRLLDILPLRGKDGYDVQFPWHSFWNLVFGYHTLEELAAVLVDIETNARAAVLLNILFPKRRSWLNGLL